MRIDKYTFIKQVIFSALFIVVAGSVAALSAQCPPDMAAINNGYCIDMYEYPNRAGEYPQNNVSQQQAGQLCAKQGKRLCSYNEWSTACSGASSTQFPYGNKYLAGKCSDPSAPDGEGLYPSGSLKECTAGNGVYDMSGNLWEWTAESYSGGKKKGIQGGSSTDSMRNLSCRGQTAEDASWKDPYIGFRCCADAGPVSASASASPAAKKSSADRKKARQRISPMTQHPVPRAPKGLFANLEYSDPGEIVNSEPIDSFVSTYQYSLTAGYQFGNGLLDYTRMEFRTRTRDGITTQSDRHGANVYHGAYAMTNIVDFDKWSGDIAVGVRFYDDEYGDLTEYYIVQELSKGKFTLTPSVNYLSTNIQNSSGSEDEVGGSLHVRYNLTSYWELFGQYDSRSFYKGILNDFVIPHTPMSSTLHCNDCRDYSASAGIVYRLKNYKSRIYFIYNDIDDLNAPMGGATVNF